MSALLALNCPRRIILTGTPMQNNLEEYYGKRGWISRMSCCNLQSMDLELTVCGLGHEAMISFVCPGLLGPVAAFKKVFAEPIARANERDATPEEKALAQERSNELMSRVEKFMLRRTAAVNSAYLPPLNNYVVFCKLTAVQVS